MEPEFTPAAQRWIKSLPAKRRDHVAGSLDVLRRHGTSLGRPLVDRIHSSRIHNLKELRSGTHRLLFVFDRGRPLMLVGGDKRTQGNDWYRPQIKAAEKEYARHLRATGREVPWEKGHGRGSGGRSR